MHEIVKRKVRNSTPLIDRFYKMVDIWELAKMRLNESQRKNGAEKNEDETLPKSERTDSCVIVCGSKNCGKTSLIMRFLDKEELPKSTIALEYTYGRRTRVKKKDVAHIWELGGGPFLANLLEIPIVDSNIEVCSLILMLDLSQPDLIWNTVTILVECAKKRIEFFLARIKSQNWQLWTRIQNSIWVRIGTNHVDKKILKPFPIPLAIVGAKYDIFQDMESEKKKAVCKTLRVIAHINGASLQEYQMKVRVDPARDPQYKEECIDKLRQQKDLELERYIHQKKKKMEQEKEEINRNTAKTAKSEHEKTILGKLLQFSIEESEEKEEKGEQNNKITIMLHQQGASDE